MNEDEIKDSIKTLLYSALEGINQDCCDIDVKSIDLKNSKVTVEFDLVIIEDDKFAGFCGY